MVICAFVTGVRSAQCVWGVFFKQPSPRMAQYLCVNIRGSVIVNSLEKTNGGISAGQRKTWPFRLSVQSASTCQENI